MGLDGRGSGGEGHKKHAMTTAGIPEQVLHWKLTYQ